MLLGGRRRSTLGSPSTSSRANPCIMERSNRGHRSSEGCASRLSTACNTASAPAPAPSTTTTDVRFQFCRRSDHSRIPSDVEDIISSTVGRLSLTRTSHALIVTRPRNFDGRVPVCCNATTLLMVRVSRSKCNFARFIPSILFDDKRIC